MVFPDRVKPWFLLLVLTYMVGSYFYQPQFQEPLPKSYPAANFAKILCRRRQLDQDGCRAKTQEALVMVDLQCMSARRDLQLCVYPSGTFGGGVPWQRQQQQWEEKMQHLCSNEIATTTKCLNVRLEEQLLRRGFTVDEIESLNIGDEGDEGAGDNGQGVSGDGEEVTKEATVDGHAEEREDVDVTGQNEQDKENPQLEMHTEAQETDRGGSDENPR